MVMVRLQTDGRVCVETFKDFPSLGRITLRDESSRSALSFNSNLQLILQQKEQLPLERSPNLWDE
jgi:hypothetical protein